MTNTEHSRRIVDTVAHFLKLAQRDVYDATFDVQKRKFDKSMDEFRRSFDNDPCMFGAYDYDADIQALEVKLHKTQEILDSWHDTLKYAMHVFLEGGPANVPL